MEFSLPGITLLVVEIHAKKKYISGQKSFQKCIVVEKKADFYNVKGFPMLIIQPCYFDSILKGIVKSNEPPLVQIKCQSILCYLVDEASNKCVLAHGRILVKVTGPTLPTLLLPQQTRDVNH